MGRTGFRITYCRLLGFIWRYESTQIENIEVTFTNIINIMANLARCPRYFHLQCRHGQGLLPRLHSVHGTMSYSSFPGVPEILTYQ